MHIFDELKERGLVYQASNENGIREILSQKGNSFYIGYDPTASSLHIGHLLSIVLAKRLEKAGLKPLMLVGGVTGLIGDPSGKSQERVLQDEKTVKAQAAAVKKQLSRFFDFRKRAALVNNYDWFAKMTAVEFLRDVGKYFSIADMLSRESVKTRLQTGISYTEFSYMMLQSYDFSKLLEKSGCRLQIGGSDQWGNITAGIEYVRKTTSREVCGFTIPLITKSDGSKFGKSESGAIWLDAAATSPYNFYQFWINTDDADAIRFLNYFSFLPMDDIGEIEKSFKSAPEKREAQKQLASEITAFVHGEKAVSQAEHISKILFEGAVKELKKEDFVQIFSGANPVRLEPFKEMPFAEFLVSSGVVGSKRQAREDMENKAIELNGEKINDTSFMISSANFLHGRYIMVKRGKKDYRFIEVKK